MNYVIVSHMPSFSFDIVSEIDKAEINNVFMVVEKEISTRFDFKNTPAAIDWLNDKDGFIVVGSNDWQVETIIDIIRKKLASRNLTSKLLDLEKTASVANLKTTKRIPFVSGLDQDKAKQITALIRAELPKLKLQIQSETVRVTGSSKDELQNCIAKLRATELDFPIQFINFR
jgi:uncharacterized protein YajQ (UPF0234 family)